MFKTQNTFLSLMEKCSLKKFFEFLNQKENNLHILSFAMLRINMMFFMIIFISNLFKYRGKIHMMIFFYLNVYILQNIPHFFIQLSHNLLYFIFLDGLGILILFSFFLLIFFKQLFKIINRGTLFQSLSNCYLITIFGQFILGLY